MIELLNSDWNDPNINIDKSIPSAKSKVHFIDFLLTDIFFFTLKNIKVEYISLAILILKEVFMSNV